MNAAETECDEWLGSVGWCLQDSVYKGSDVAVLLDEIHSCQDVLSRIADMKLGHLGTALVTIINQVTLSPAVLSFCDKFTPYILGSSEKS